MQSERDKELNHVRSLF